MLRSAADPDGPLLRGVDTPVQLARRAMVDHPLAVVLGVCNATLSHLDVIPVLRAIRSELPVIVIAEEDSLDLERAVRQNAIFYYLVHPLQRREVRAVLRNLLRRARA